MIHEDEAARRLDQALEAGRISRAAAANVRRWLSEPPFEAYRPRLIEDVVQGRWAELDEAFFDVLEFGTGGRRGRMYPVGIHVLNERTIAESARGLADYVASRRPAGAALSCVVAHDTRHHSAEFAELCARVLAAAGFRVYLFQGHRSTPLLSFSVRHLGCDAGIMITASHNPPSDNGFKCYSATGGQVVPPDDQGIIECVKAAADRAIPEKPLADGLADGSIVWTGPELDRAYWNAVVRESVAPARDVSIVYTPLHGVGEGSVAAALREAGFTQVHVLESQRAPDGDFPNVPNHVANPERPEALATAMKEARERGADLAIASDPDADRIGVAVPSADGPNAPWTTLDGNQIGVLLSAFVMREARRQGRLRPEHYLVTTLVSTEMARALATIEGVRVEDDLLVGFKWIAERIERAGPANFLFAFEESHGYLKGRDVRDKDAAVGSLLFAELTATLQARGQTVLDYLDGLFLEVGHHGERLLNKVYEGRAGHERIEALMKAFRQRPPRALGGLPLVEVRDYLKQEVRALGPSAGPARPLPHPSGDLLIFRAERPGMRFAVRPSGTEPKIKLYLFARSEVAGREQLPAAKRETQRLLDAMTADLERFIDETLSTGPSTSA